jgi:phosphate regulon transcriptional regulator PhoB
MNATVLLIEDERAIIELLKYNLTREGYGVVCATDGETGLELLEHQEVDLVLLDLMLPGMQGFDVCRILRERSRTRALPIIMLTARAEEADKVLGLELGADDYVTKPFSVRELLARIRAQLRRAQALRDEAETEPETITRGEITIDLKRYTVTAGDRTLRLSPTEFSLLKVMAGRPGRVYTREELLDRVWGDDAFVEPRTVDVHIRRLRATLEPDPQNPRWIKTVRGVGYTFEESQA